MNKKPKSIFAIKDIAILGVLLALYVVTGVFSIRVGSIFKLGFTFVAIATAGAIYGPVAGGMVGGLGDVLAFLVNPTGAYFPGFTLTAFLSGVVFGVFLKKNPKIFHIIIASFIVEFVGGLVLNTFWISIIVGKAYSALVPGRALQAVCMFVVQVVVITLMNRFLYPILHKLTKPEEEPPLLREC